jgi:predicted metal-dependent enzyme (double-stranded beta helix superfamily)
MTCRMTWKGAQMNTLLAFETTHQTTRTAPPAPPVAMAAAARLLTRLMSDPSFLNAQVLPHLELTSDAGPYVAHRYDVPGAFKVEIFVWPPHAASDIHDHSSWGAFGCALGSLQEERYRRLDDSTRLNYAHLKKLWQRVWRREDGVSTLLPFDGGIHRVSNPGDQTAISIHIYGPAGAVDGRDYDPSRNYVCDRLD